MGSETGERGRVTSKGEGSVTDRGEGWGWELAFTHRQGRGSQTGEWGRVTDRGGGQGHRQGRGSGPQARERVRFGRLRSHTD